MQMDCIFCKIISGEIPSSKVYEDDTVLAFLDINPVNKGHSLVIPKKHSANLLEDDIGDLTNCMSAIQKVARATMAAVNADGFNLMANTKPVAGQIVFHTHFHIVPRFEGDGLRHWPGIQIEDKERDAIRESIVNNL